jgi:hypothetical protein
MCISKEHIGAETHLGWSCKTNVGLHQFLCTSTTEQEHIRAGARPMHEHSRVGARQSRSSHTRLEHIRAGTHYRAGAV